MSTWLLVKDSPISPTLVVTICNVMYTLKTSYVLFRGGPRLALERRLEVVVGLMLDPLPLRSTAIPNDLYGTPIMQIPASPDDSLVKIGKRQ